MSEKWWDMSDDELDDLFREASDKADIPFDQSALDKLRQKIDFKPIPPATTPQQGFKKRWLALVALLLFFGVALLYTFSGKKDDSTLNNNSNTISENELPSSTNNKITNSKEHKKATTPHQEELNDLKTLPKNDKSIAVIEENNTVKANESKINSTSPKTVAESEFIQHENSTNLRESSTQKWNKKERKEGYSLNKKASNKDLANNNISENNSLINKSLDISNEKSDDEKNSKTISELEKNKGNIIKSENNNSEENSSVNSNFSKTNKKALRLKKSMVDNIQENNLSPYSETNIPILAPPIISENKPKEEETIVKTNFYNVDFLSNKSFKSLETNVESESPTYVDVPPIAMKQPKFSRFGIRLAIAPEINSIEKMETSAVVGSLFGLLLEYRLTKKLTLQTGVSYSKKTYTGNFDYYRAWTGGTGTKPLNIDGICKVVDIPINLRLNAFQMKRNTFFISGGVSSYLMSDEIYTYNYAWGPPKVRDWTGNSSNFYWSTLNLSAGVERKMNKHFTLQVEPFLKTPLTGVGRGLVNLYSSGLLFSTKYEF